MPTHTVQSGESIYDIAGKYDVPDWRAIWWHAGNAALRLTRPSPSVLLAGDSVYIPETRREALCRTGGTYTFQASTPTLQLRVAIRHADASPAANRPYELKIGEETFSGKLNRDGRLEHDAPVSATQAELKVWLRDPPRNTTTLPPPATRTLKLGGVDPVESVAGLQQRLVNLGYLEEGHGETTLDVKTKAALQRFQEDYGMPPTGDMDKHTLRQLVVVFGV